MLAGQLFRIASREASLKLQLMGYDVEKPDLLGAFPAVRFEATEVYAAFPRVDQAQCRFCGACVSFCTCGALRLERQVPSITIDPERCEACGDCIQGCNLHGISTRERLTGYILKGRLNGNLITIGKGDEHHDYLVPLICALNDHLVEEAVSICDLGPGNSGFVLSALKNTTLALIVQRPARGWERNIRFLLDALRGKHIAGSVVINKYRGESGFLNEVETFCESEQLPLLGVIPFYGELEISNNRITDMPGKEIDPIFAAIWEKIALQF